MIAKLTGIVDFQGEDWAVVDVSGVGYRVFCSGRTLGRMTVGEAVTVLGETHVREDHIHLYGFADAMERDWFRLLPTVDPGLKVNWNALTETWRIIQFTRQSRTVFLSVIGISWFWFFGATYLAQFPNFTRVVLHEIGRAHV